MRWGNLGEVSGQVDGEVVADLFDGGGDGFRVGVERHGDFAVSFEERVTGHRSAFDVSG